MGLEGEGQVGYGEGFWENNGEFEPFKTFDRNRLCRKKGPPVIVD
jgi:hypothetical protein